MANFQNNAITESGILLRSHVDMGAVFTATKIVIGSGFIPAGKTAKTMTGVVTPVKELAINKKQRSPDGKAIFGGVYTNENVSATFYFRELALYAKAVYPNGTEVAEVLYCYGNAGNDAELMAAYSTNTAVERQMDIVTFVGNEAEVDLTIESGIFMTRKQVEEMLAELGTRTHANTHAIGGADQITPEMIGAEKVLGVVPDNDLFVWVDKQTTGGSFLVAPDRTTTNIPTASVSWFIGHLDYNVSGKRITMTELNTLRTWVNVTRENIFTGWFELANINDVIRKSGDKVNGELQFENFGEYYTIRKGRTIANGKTHFFTIGLSSGGSTTLEHYTCDSEEFDSTKLDGRLELGQVGGANDWLNSYALVLRSDNANGPTYRIYGEHFSPAVTAAAELV